LGDRCRFPFFDYFFLGTSVNAETGDQPPLHSRRQHKYSIITFFPSLLHNSFISRSRTVCLTLSARVSRPFLFHSSATPTVETQGFLFSFLCKKCMNRQRPFPSYPPPLPMKTRLRTLRQELECAISPCTPLPVVRRRSHADEHFFPAWCGPCHAKNDGFDKPLV